MMTTRIGLENKRAARSPNSPDKSPSDRAIESIVQIDEATHQARSRLDHLFNVVIRWAGSGTCILFHAVLFGLWSLANVNVLPDIRPFDPFLFNLLTTVVSLEAILTLFVLIVQNRMSREADQPAHLDLHVNLLAEQEATAILHILHGISKHLGVRAAVAEDLLQETVTNSPRSGSAFRLTNAHSITSSSTTKEVVNES